MKHLLIILAFLTANSLLANEAQLKSKIEQLPMMKTIGASITKVITQNNLYHFKAEVKGARAGKFEGFLTQDLKNMIVGKVYNTQTQEELIIPFDINVKNLKSVAAYKMGNGKKEFFLFSDPECPYCQRLEKKLTALKDDVTLYVVLYPLSFHKNARSMCHYVLNQKDDAAKAKAMKEIANKDTKYANATYSKMQLNILNDMLQKSLNEASKIGIEGTPTILDAKGFKTSPSMIIK